MKNKLKQKIYLLILFSLVTTLGFAQPEPCGTPPTMTQTCLEACVICDIDGFTGRNDIPTGGQAFSNFCTFDFDRMAYIAFIAGTEDLEIQVSVTNCVGWSGLEIGIFESFDCVNFTAVTLCDTDILANTTQTFTNTSPLVVGQHYYLVMDGSSGTICDWTFEVLSGSTAVNPLLNSGNISGNTVTCSDLPTTFSTTGTIGAALFYWTINGTPQNETTQIVDLTFPEGGFYEVCVTAANVCNDAPPTCTIVTVETPDTTNLVEEICDNDCFEVAGETICETGNYEFVIPLPNGCDSTIFLDLTVLPQAQEVVDINLCVGEEFLIGNTPYSTTGIFFDTILTSADCDSIVTLDLFMIECEIIGSTNFTSPICNGDVNGQLIFSVENGTPPFTYVWEHITNTTINGNGSTLLFTDNEIDNVPAGFYEINIMDTFGNDVVLFQEVTEPSVLSVATDAIAIDDFNLSCNGGMDGTATAIGNGGVSPYTYLWSDNQIGPQANNLSMGTYTVSITDDNGCVQENNITLTEPPMIEYTVNFVDPNCDGFETGFIQIDTVWGGTPSYSYAMEEIPIALNQISYSSTRLYENLSGGNYQVFIQDDNDCVAEVSGTLTPPDIPVLYMGDDLEVDLGCDILIPVNTNNTNLVEIQWIDSNGTLDCDTCLRPYASPLDLTEYFLTVTSIDDCVTSDSIRVNVNKVRDIFVPNAFTPNGDGFNDKFFINANKSVSLIKNIKVFNRWGAVVYEETDLPPNDISSGWDGYFNGELMNTGVYVWIAEIEYLDGFVVTASGDVTLVL